MVLTISYNLIFDVLANSDAPHFWWFWRFPITSFLMVLSICNVALKVLIQVLIRTQIRTFRTTMHIDNLSDVHSFSYVSFSEFWAYLIFLCCFILYEHDNNHPKDVWDSSAIAFPASGPIAGGGGGPHFQYLYIYIYICV